MYAIESQIPILDRSLQVLEIKSFKHLLEQGGENFIKQHYTDVELRVSDRGKRRIQYLAGRWAAKKAVIDILENNLFYSDLATLPQNTVCDRISRYPSQRLKCSVPKPNLAPDLVTSNLCLEISIVRLVTGQPLVILSGSYQKTAARLGIKRWLLSISHTDIYAVASTIAIV